MSEIDSSKLVVLCACGCGQPLNPNHLQEQIYVTLGDGSSILINMSCYEAAYGSRFGHSADERRWPKPEEHPSGGGEDGYSCVYRGPGGPGISD